MQSSKRCTQCGARFSRELHICPVCGHEAPGARAEHECPECGASVPEGSRVCPFCGATLHGSNAGLLPVIGRVATTIAVLALGAALIWWILPLGLATGNGTPVQMSLAVSSPVVTATTSPAPEGKAFAEELTTAAEMAEPAVSVTPLASTLASNEGVSETATAPASLGVTEEASPVPAETSGPLTHTVAQ